MSTDKHSAYTLLAGTAQLQTEASFSNSWVNGPFVGYENAQANPGLLGTTLQNVLNFSTATIFRASGDGSGTCNTTNVDTAGLTRDPREDAGRILARLNLRSQEKGKHLGSNMVPANVAFDEPRAMITDHRATSEDRHHISDS